MDGFVSYLPSFVGRSLDLQEEVKIEIVKAVDGMYVALMSFYKQTLTSLRFLLAQLHLDFLVGKRPRKATRAALNNLPSGPTRTTMHTRMQWFESKDKEPNKRSLLSRSYHGSLVQKDH